MSIIVLFLYNNMTDTIDTINTIWLLYHTGIIYNIDDGNDFTNFAQSNQLLGKLVENEKKKQRSKIFKTVKSSAKLFPYRFEISHQILAQNIDNISVQSSVFNNSEYSTLTLVDSDNNSNIVNNTSMIIPEKESMDRDFYVYETQLPHQKDVIYKLDKICIHHSPCKILHALLSYATLDYINIHGKICDTSPSITTIMFSETPYNVPSICPSYHQLFIHIISDTEIQTCDVKIDMYFDIGVDDIILAQNPPKTYYTILDNIMLYHQFIAGLVASTTNREYIRRYGDTLCRTIDVPSPNKRFTKTEMLNWLKKYQIIQINTFCR